MQRELTSRPYEGYEIRLRLERRRKSEPVELATPRAVYEFMRGMADESAEHVYELLTDRKLRLGGIYLVSKGGISTCSFDPKEIFKAALVTNSPSFMLVHNHPSGVVEPSSDDIAMVDKVKGGAHLLDLDFLDSLIVGDSSYFSFREAGRM